MSQSPLVVGERALTITDVVRVARHHESVTLCDTAISRMQRSRDVVDAILESDIPVYGINTGFGELSRVFISHDSREELQRNLILSHCTGVGPLLPEETVRAAILLRVNSLAMGFSGIRVGTVQKLIELLNLGITPAVPAQGSVGASGDLAPLAHLAAVLLGEGFVLQNGAAVPARSVLDSAGFVPITLAGKEGLALINGTQIMTAVAALCCHDAAVLMKSADISAALSTEALQGTRTAFDSRIAMVRPHKGQMATAANMLQLTEDSAIIQNHLHCEKLQDAYSIRCIPQVHGASKDCLVHVCEVIETEINSVTDNPLVFPDTGEVLSGGNFHGQPVALAMDSLKVALCELGNISERRLSRLVDSNLSHLPAFLTAYPGVNSGFMILQYTAASLVSENKVLAHPASADSIPTSANQEDHVSMGTIAARQVREILTNVQNVIAIECMAACQGIDFLQPFLPGDGTRAALALVREHIPHLEYDRILAPEIEQLRMLLHTGALLDSVEQAVGELQLQ